MRREDRERIGEEEKGKDEETSIKRETWGTC
jgi:hypothetical protein